MFNAVSFRVRGTFVSVERRAAFFVMDEFKLYDRVLTKKEVELDAKSQLLPVTPERKLTTI